MQSNWITNQILRPTRQKKKSDKLGSNRHQTRIKSASNRKRLQYEGDTHSIDGAQGKMRRPRSRIIRSRSRYVGQRGKTKMKSDKPGSTRHRGGIGYSTRKENEILTALTAFGSMLLVTKLNRRLHRAHAPSLAWHTQASSRF